MPAAASGRVPTERAATQEYLLGRVKWLEDTLKELAADNCEGLLDDLTGLSHAVTELTDHNEHATSADWLDWLRQHLTAATDHAQTLKQKLCVLEDVTATLRDQLDGFQSR